MYFKYLILIFRNFIILYLSTQKRRFLYRRFLVPNSPLKLEAFSLLLPSRVRSFPSMTPHSKLKKEFFYSPFKLEEPLSLIFL